VAEKAVKENLDGADSATSPFSAPQINLPKGGGAIRGIGEKFTANAVTGTSALSIPISVSAARSGFSPQLALSYDSGAGNGVFGVGWSLSSPSITRKTDKGLPQYRDAEECDVFLLSGQEDLVPVLVRKGDGCWRSDECERDGYRIKQYRPRIEGLFARIERWTRAEDGDMHWRSISKDNVLTLYGSTRESRICDPDNDRHIFSWLIAGSFDDLGNAIAYEYVAENECGVNREETNERHRTRTANRYLKRVMYGNRTPLRGEVEPREDAAWMFELVFDFGDEAFETCPANDDGKVFVEAPNEPGGGRSWRVRKDPFSRYRSGFEIRTYRLCERVLQFHRFPEELHTERCLIQSMEMEYEQKRFGTFLIRATHAGYVRESEGRYLRKSLPPLDLTYSTSPLENENLESGFALQTAELTYLPQGIDGSNYRWLDLDGVGISGVLSEQGAAWYYKKNLGHGRFGATAVVSRIPAAASLAGGQQLLDVAGDGNLDLVEFAPGHAGFYERATDSAGWLPFRTFPSLPVIDWADPNLRFVDVTGDGIADVLITEDFAYKWHASHLRGGFGEERRVARAIDEEQGPRVLFDDGENSLYLADMSGDGLSDLVRIRNGEVCYWPNLGYGRFGMKVSMDNSPWFDWTDQFDLKRVQLADTDGSGATDILYLSAAGIDVYLNQAGNGFSGRRRIEGIPTDDFRSIAIADFLGRGTACVVWSSPLPSDAQRSLRYVDLMCGRKPHLLIGMCNNLGVETAIEYASSTEFYLADEAAGRPWATRLPFPVHVVKRVVTHDAISRNRFVSRSSYHHGYFDGVEREFRGFGRVETLDTEEFGDLTESGQLPGYANEHASWNVPPVLTKTWFHTGVFLGGDRISRHLAHEYYREPHEAAEMLLDDTILPHALAPEEAREACRALKGAMLRQEIYALDGMEESGRPYTATESNFTIRSMQPREWNRHAVFLTHAREQISFNFERKLYEIDGAKRADPRVAHAITLKVDEYGNVLRSASIGYGRRFPQAFGVEREECLRKQERILLTLTEVDYTNAVQESYAYRSPRPAETRVYELLNIEPDADFFGVTNLFRFEEFQEKEASASDGNHDLSFESRGAEDRFGCVPCRRLFQCSRKVYRSDMLNRLLPPGTLESRALPGKTYQLAFTPSLIRDVFRRNEQGQREVLMRDPETVMQEGGYVDLDEDGQWWIPSGVVFYSADARDDAKVELEHARRHFFRPQRYRDPFGNTALVTYDAHDLTVIATRDAAGNVVTSATDYRVLAPRLVSDANRNRTATSFDALGMLAGTAVMGKEGDGEGDSLDGFEPDLTERTILRHTEDPLLDPGAILGQATARYVYDLFAFMRTRDDRQPQPAVSYALAREMHESDLGIGERAEIQHSFSYSDGFGRIVQKKVQAAPGPLENSEPPEHAMGNGQGPDEARSGNREHVHPRWAVSGWTISNNKGNAVRQYEPFFSATQRFEFAHAVGVSSTLFYDPAGRVIATLHPEHTHEKVVFDPWQQVTWDVNDTLLERDPSYDRDVGGYLRRLPADEYLPTWYEQRRNGAMGEKAKEAAEQAATHARTPKTAYFDTLGRPFLTVDINRAKHDGRVTEQHIATSVELDIQGQELWMTDALERRFATFAYDMAGRRIYQSMTDAGERWALFEIKKKPLRTWDSRGFRFRYQYDVLQRLTRLFVRAGHDAEKLAERIDYGEGQPQDVARNLRGRISRRMDQAGVATNQRYDFRGNLLNSSRQLLHDYRELVDWDSSPEIEERVFASSTRYDALNRPIEIVAPDTSVIRPEYDEMSLLDKLSVNLRGSDDATAFVTKIEYNAKGQRELIEFGNGARTHYGYDPLTYRLVHLKTRRKSGDAVLQDLKYTYDAIGNVVSIVDRAQHKVYFDNQVVTASNDYVYDAIYRLIGAQGREHAGNSAGRAVDWDDEPRMDQPLPSDGQAMRCYRESYGYDLAGNILELIHHASSEGWRRQFEYAEGSNRLERGRVGQLEEQYSYDANGNMVRMPHLPLMKWDFKNQLCITREQVVKQGAGPRTFYVYDAGGARVRKVTERSDGSKAHERIYLGGFEIYREYERNKVTLERETLHVIDDKRRIALVETKTVDIKCQSVNLPATLTRYQFSNQLGSSCLELDEEASVLSYEEYYPFGSTSYEAARRQVDVSPKRYRYTGKERDNETGLYYHGVRYYAPWLGRWTACDPAGLKDGSNLYAFCSNNPITLVDRAGMEGEKPEADESDDPNAATKKRLQDTVANAKKEIAERKQAMAPLIVAQYDLTVQRDKLAPGDTAEREKLQKQIDANKEPLQRGYDKIARLQEEVDESNEVIAKIDKLEAEAKEDEKPKLGVDISIQYNPSDLGKNKSGSTVNLPSGEAQLVLLARNWSIKDWDKHLPLGLTGLSVGKELAVVGDFKYHKTDEDNSNVAPPYLAVQITAANLEWKLKQGGRKVDFVEVGLPVQVLLDTGLNLKWQAAGELDVHLDALIGDVPKLTSFGTASVGGTINNPDPDNQRRFINSEGVGFGLKASF
jgi:RHS repeat-associated protein